MAYSISPISVSPDPALTVGSVSAHLRLNDTSEDDLLEDWISAAVDLFEAQTGFITAVSTHQLKLDDWPCGRVIQIPRHPVLSVNMVSYLNTSGEWVELSDWTADLSSVPARIVLPTSLPALATDRVARVLVSFDAGHEDTGDIPRLALQAVKLLVSHWYRQREAFGEARLSEVPAGWSAVCNRFRIGILGGIE